MKILYIHQYFRTPADGGPIRSYYLAKGLVDKGFEVDMITSYNGNKKLIKDVDGIRVHYLPIYYDNSFSFKRRLVSFLKFMYTAVDEAATIDGVDLCYASSTPLTVGMAAIKIKDRLKIPYIFEVRDLWPEAPIQMGAIRNPWLLRYTQDLEQRIYDQAEQIVALSPGMQQGVARKVSDKPITLIPNMSDVEFFQPETKNPRLEEKFRTKDSFVISYFGAMGKANHLEYLLESAAESIRGDLPIKFLVVGEGAEREKLYQESRKRKLTNVSFLPYMNKKEIREMLNVTDASYISFANKPILETNSPNKFFDSLASGKLVITNTKGWIRELSEENECGVYVDPSDQSSFSTQISPFLTDHDALTKYQYNARSLGENQFSKKTQINKLAEVLG